MNKIKETKILKLVDEGSKSKMFHNHKCSCGCGCACGTDVSHDLSGKWFTWGGLSRHWNVN